ncbi:MAG: substrate-binding domain-containing protein [Proteobacteria bacterium]|nr:substrate-binding domain-containing protein [Pseudomonadota bacterium]
MNSIFNRKRFTWMIYFLGCFLFVPVAAAEVYIIVNTTIPVSALSKNELRDIYIGKRTIWNGNLKIVPVIAPSLSLHDEFVLKYTRKSSSQFKIWWLKLVFSGEGAFPKTASSEKEMIEKVSENEGAIGYVSSEINTDRVKTIVIYDKDEMIKTFEKSKGTDNE